MSYCNTNSIAMSMAGQLLNAGEEAVPLIIVDAKPAGLELQPLTMLEKVFIYTRWILHGEFAFISRKFSIGGNIAKHKAADLPTVNTPLEDSAVGRFEKLLKNANMHYKLKPYAGGIFYIQSNELLRKDTLKRIHKTWKKIVRGTLATYTFDGDHISFFREENAERFTKIIESILARSLQK